MHPLENSLLVFRTNHNAIGIYDHLFGGFYRADWLVRYEKMAVFFFFALAIGSLIAQYRTKKDLFGVGAKACGLLGFTLLVVLLNEPVDEVFINLRHSLHFSETGLFSFNKSIPIEGIVDFLPYFLLGCFAKLGLPLPEMAFIQAWLGGVLCLFAMARMAKSMGLQGIRANFLFVLLCANPTLIFNSSIGFSSPIFTAAILWSIALLFFEPKRLGLGLLGLAIIPLIRLEGGLASVLLLLAYGSTERKSVKSKIASLFIRGAAIAPPILLLSIYRFLTFGSPIPTPVKYKASFGYWSFAKLGFANFVSDLFGGYGALALAVFTIVLVMSYQDKRSQRIRPLVLPLLAMGIFVSPYYISGGDWFPSAWGRYLLPFTMFATFSAIASFLMTIVSMNRTRRSLLAGLIGLAASPYLFFPSAYSLLNQNFHEWWCGRGNFRIQQLSMLGNHLGATTRPTDVIASSEVATVMYFAHREALDLLGVANPAIASRPITDTSLFRRHYPELVTKQMPQFVYPGDFLSTELSSQSTRPDITIDIKRLRLTYQVMNEIFFGGPEKLLQAGYRPVLVIFGNHFSAMYYVSPEAWPSHLASLIETGFRQDNEPAPLISQR